MQPRSDLQTESLIKEWLFRFGVNFEKDVAPYLPLWTEAFGTMNPEVLLRLFQRAMRACKFWPTVAEILAPLETAEEGNYEEEWQALLEYCEKWVNRDVPNVRGKPQLPADIDHAARAAGGVRYLESCSQHDLIFAKQRFIEDLARQRKTGDVAGFLPCSELRAMIDATTSHFALSKAASAFPVRRLEHNEAFSRPLLRRVGRTADLKATIRQGESLWAASQPRQNPV